MQRDRVPFYDNAPCEYDEHGRRFIDRIYCFAWDSFTKEDWRELGKAYELLPAWLGYGVSGFAKNCPVWFGDYEDEDCSHLSASVELPGLQVAGDVTDNELEQWHTRFVEIARNWPWRDIDSRTRKT